MVLALSAFAAYQAGGAATDFLPSVNIENPPLAEMEAEAALADPPPRRARRVVLIIVDGLRLGDSFGVPFLDGLRRRGIDAAAVSHYPTISRPNYVTILTGVPPLWSGVRTNDYSARVELESLMGPAGAAPLSSASVADYSDGLAYMFSDEFDDTYYATWPDGLVKSARRVLARDYDLVVLLPGEVDAAGHEYGAESPEYRAAVASVDRKLARALSGVDLEKDAVVVVADHGHTDEGGHGGTEPEVLDVPLILAGAGVEPGAVLRQGRLIDVAPTVAALLGKPPPRHGLGHTLTAALDLEPGAASRIRALDSLRVLRNLSVAEARATERRDRRGERRTVRLLVVGAFLFGAVGILFFARRLGALHLDWRVLLVAVPAFPLSYYALLDLFGQEFSLSAVPDQGTVVSLLLGFGVVSTAIHVVASWVALRGRVVLRDRLAAANALTLCGIFIAWVPAALMWAIYAAPPFISVPGSAVMVLVPATFIAVACFAFASTVVLGLEIVIFFARAVDPRIRIRRLERKAERERERLEVERR